MKKLIVISCMVLFTSSCFPIIDFHVQGPNSMFYSACYRDGGYVIANYTIGYQCIDPSHEDWEYKDYVMWCEEEKLEPKPKKEVLGESP